MPKRTLQEVIDAAKSGEAVSPDECLKSMLALHSMLSYSRMQLEVISDKAGNAEKLYYTVNALISADQVRRERERWMNTVPAEYLEYIETTQKKLEELKSNKPT
ncbi:hypothetical protein IR083_10000 [Dysgonomonas sp. GY75]|uniref:hypothetical protein n=1 Tax=Dysgonomonas sp. GY75 TaxID=2780419 RepID=UPI0018833077|nr:hypothetical protein [Dysgonomonas sp. GY75]MBF0649152.1 hypothetical protein [Dysgonomonas sp. GY75]